MDERSCVRNRRTLAHHDQRARLILHDDRGCAPVGARDDRPARHYLQPAHARRDAERGRRGRRALRALRDGCVVGHYRHSGYCHQHTLHLGWLATGLSGYDRRLSDQPWRRRHRSRRRRLWHRLVHGRRRRHALGNLGGRRGCSRDHEHREPRRLLALPAYPDRRRLGHQRHSRRHGDDA